MAANTTTAQEGELVARAEAALSRAEELTGASFERGSARADELMPGVKLAIDETVERLRDFGTRKPRIAELAELLAELHDVGWLLKERALGDRLQRLDRIHDGLNRLRAIDDPDELLARVSHEVCVSCGFERGVLSRVTDSNWILQDAHFSDDPEWAASFVRVGQELTPRLSHLMLETELVRRRMPILVEDAFNDPRTFKPFVEHSDTACYVCAPIMPQNRVVGFLHADHHFSGVPVDEFDRDALWTFTEGFAHIYERAVLLARLREQRDRVRGMVTATEGVMDELCSAEIQFDRATHEGASVARSAAASLITPESESPMNELLTKRELEVLSLMSSGATNAGIAEQLVISEGTVKSHVKHILRKLRASNRAEAVSRYLRVSIPAREDNGGPR